MIKIRVEQTDGFAVLHGRNKDEWIVAPWWPCSGETIRKVAADKMSRDFVEAAASFSDTEFSKGRVVPPHGSGPDNV